MFWKKTKCSIKKHSKTAFPGLRIGAVTGSCLLKLSSGRDAGIVCTTASCTPKPRMGVGRLSDWRHNYKWHTIQISLCLLFLLLLVLRACFYQKILLIFCPSLFSCRLFPYIFYLKLILLYSVYKI